MADEPITYKGEHHFLKHVANRRLYDKSASRYGTLGDVVEAVQAGEKVVIMAGELKKYGTDATVEVLVDAFAQQQRDPRTRTVTEEELVRLIRRKKK